MPNRHKPLIERVWDRVRIGKTDECWPRLGQKQKFGYGRIRDHYRRRSVHRIVWAIANGPIPPGLSVLHKCDNPPCCNPAHLLLGTTLDNMRDMIRQGRSILQTDPGRVRDIGERHGRALLNDGRVEYIGQRRNISAFKMANLFGVHKNTIYQIRNGKTWRHLKAENP